jgi:calcium/calmodulin-dependent protein kinase I
MKRDLTELELPPPLSPKRQAAHRSVFSEDYKVVREIGRGSSGVVYEARHRATGLRAAVKVIYRVGLNATEEQAIRHEQEIIQSLNHPNIIKCYHFYDEPTVFYIILEYVTGGELFDRIVEKSHYTEKEARDLVELILLIVKHCHDRDIVHRDLKPENLLLVSVDDDEAVKLADFGMATKTEGDDLSGLFGSPAYVAPEVILGRSYGKAVDMWSLGVLVFVLLGGYLPFGDGGSWAQTQQNIIRGRFNFTDYPQVWGPVTENAKDLIRKLLHVNVDKRYVPMQFYVRCCAIAWQ